MVRRRVRREDVAAAARRRGARRPSARRWPGARTRRTFRPRVSRSSTRRARLASLTSKFWKMRCPGQLVHVGPQVPEAEAEELAEPAGRASIRSAKACSFSMTISAAAEGVEARMSATKSAMVKSTSWPTAEMTGTGERAMARATFSSLKAQRSSIDPPPRPTMRTSMPGQAPEVVDALDDLVGRALALDPGRIDEDVEPGVAPLERPQDVDDGRAGGRGDDADRLGPERELPLARRVEQALGLELLLELFEGQLEGALALGLDAVDDELVVAARLVDVDLAPADDLQPVLEVEGDLAGRVAPPDDGLELTLLSSLRVK